VHGAGATLRNAAAVFGAGETYNIADGPQQWHGWVSLNSMLLIVDFYCE
jgi:hypothetical protein